MKKMNPGMAALKKEAPAVAKKMGYNKGGMPNFKACPDCPSPAKCAKQGCQKGKTKMSYGGMAKKPMKMNRGGYCGASNPASKPINKG